MAFAYQIKVNSDINILGSLPDWSLIHTFLTEDLESIQAKGGIHTFTSIKTNRSIRRFEKAIRSTLLTYKNDQVFTILNQAIKISGITSETLLLLFWNASANNSLLLYLNETVYFPALLSGRVSIQKDEITACIQELKQTEDALKKWSINTITTTASKYLTLLKKFGLMSGTVNKKLNHPYLSDSVFVLFVYWLVAISEKPNLANSNWLKYSFSEKQIFLERLFQKKFSKYFNVNYTGDSLNIEPIKSYETIYAYITKS